jgi:photosystem II stability/assembly factor-like uncharacterized protein
METRPFIKVLFTSFIFILFLNQNSYAQWEYLHASPTGNNLYKIEFANNTTGWITGEMGTILKTTDGGNTWKNQYTLSNDNIIDLCVIDTATLFILKNSNELLASTDGGDTWTLRSLFLGPNTSSISFINANEGWEGIGTNIQHTTDGGVNWTVQYNGSGDNIASIEVGINGNGIAVTTTGNVFYTNNYGQAWLSTLTVGGNFQTTDLNTSVSIGLVIIDNVLYKSIDNGSTWTAPVNTPPTLSSTNAKSVNIFNANNYMITDGDGNLWFTSDGGNTWNNNNSMVGNSLNDCFALSNSRFLAIGDNGKIAFTTNAGSTLNSLETRVTNQELWGIHHFGSTFFAVGDAGTILKSSNDGQTWNNLNSGNTDNLRSIISINANTAVAVGNAGTILKTTNGGTSWTQISTGYSDDINVIHRIPNGTLYAVGNNELVLKSTNDGSSWTFLTTSFTGFQYNFTDVNFATNDTGFIATNSAEIITTDDGGQNWYLRMTGLFGQMTCLSFVDGLKGWIGSDNGEILYTDDGGQTWTDRSMVGFTNRIHRLKFNNQITGWAFTENGIYKTINGGLIWTKEFSPCINVRAVDFYGSYSAIAVGSGQGKIIGRDVDIQLFVGAGTYCSGHEYSLGAFTLGNYNAGNTFIAQLSDDFGSFDYTTTMTTVQATIMNSITFTIPAGIPPSNLYRVRIATTNPPMYSNVPLTTLDIRDSPQVLVYANGNTTFNNGDSLILINLSGAVGTYQWYRNGLPVMGANDDSLTVKIPGTYQLNINDGFCDGNSNAIEVIVNGLSGISSMNNVSLKHYPNPVNDNLTVELGALPFNQYQVLNLQGMEVISATGDFTGNITIPMKGLFQGFYLLKISGNNEVVIKILKD